MKRNHRLYVHLLAAILLLSSVAQGATFIVPSDRDLVRQSDAIVIGKVMARHSGIHPAFEIATFNEIEVMEWIKGSGADRVTIVEMGGALGQRIKIVPGSARFTPDERVVLFLKRNSRGEWASLNMALGKFSSVIDEDGRRLLLRSVSDEEIYGWTPAGKLHQEQSRFEVSFLRFIRSTVAGVSAQENYFVPDSAGVRPRLKANEITVTAANDYLLTANVGGIGGCVGSIGGFRWSIFDTNPVGSDPPGCGGGVCYRTNGSQTGQTDSLGSTNRGIAAWANEPNSGVVAGVIGTTAVAAPNGDDGVNAIIFNYNGPEWASNPSAIGLGIVNANSCYQRGGENFVNTIDGDVIIKVGVTLMVADFDGLMCHEVGHTFGFRHSDQGSPSSSNAVMRSILVNGLGANLTAWDMEAVQAVYGAGPVCTNTSIGQHPQSTTVESGGSTTLSVTAGGTAPLAFQWFRGTSPSTSNPVAGGTFSSLNTGALTTTTSFWVRVTNCSGAGTANSNTATVTVAACVGVGISQQPTANPTSVTQGSSTTLSVSVSGSAPHAFQWFRGTPGDTSSPVSGATTASASSGPVNANTTYWVRVTNCSAASSVNSLGVSVTATPCVAPPITSGTPADASVQSGGSTTLTVLHGGVGPFSYQWFRGETGDVSSGVVGSSQTLNTGALSANTRFWVRVREACGQASDSRSALVTVSTVCTSPSISVNPANTSVLTGGSANLSVIAGGTSVQYQWFRGQSPSEASPIAGANSASFNTGALTTTTSFWVKVFHSCSLNVARSNTATVTVGVACVLPSITTQPQSRTIDGNERVTLSVVAAGAAPLRFQWFQGLSGQPSTPMAGATSSSFTTPFHTNTTSYWVRVTNDCTNGTVDSSTATLTVQIKRKRPSRRR